MSNELRDWMRLIETTLLVEDGQDFCYYCQDEVASQMHREYNSGTPTQPWRLVPAARLIAIWKNAAKVGFVQDTSGLEQIARRMIENTARLVINTEIAGHTQGSTEDYLEHYGIEVDDVEAFVSWAVDLPNGGWRISDYGLSHLIKLAGSLMDITDDLEKLSVIDQMLNVTHQRSDLASWFVEGGTKTLNRLHDE